MRWHWSLLSCILGCNSETLLLGTSPPPRADSTSPPAFDPADADGPVQDAALATNPSVVMDAAAPFRAPVFEAPVVVEELLATTENLNPTLTSDQALLLFNSNGQGDASVGGKDLFIAEWSKASDAFEAPALLDLSSEEFDTSPAIEGDGLAMWFATRVDGDPRHLDIYRASRDARDAPFGEPMPVSELNSDADDIPRPLGQGGLVMPFASRRNGEYETFFAIRPALDEPFTVITQAPLATIQTSDRRIEDAFLSEDGLELWFAHAGDLYFTTRSSVDDIFREAVAVDSINTDATEIDPWLSPDGQTLYFVSDRASDAPQILRARRRQ